MSEINSESEEKPLPKPKSDDTVLELQLGDVIQISNPLNDNLNDQTFIIDYIDKTKAYLINTDTLERLRLSIDEDGTIGDGNITRIAILSRSDTPSYARQNELLPGKWINIYFEGDFPVIITGEITNLENDMIEIKTVDDDVIYINFDYKGLPENLPIQMIEIRERPSELLVQAEKEVEPLEEIPELEVEKKFVEPEKIQLTIPVKDIKNQIREFIVKADQVQFGDEEFGPIREFVDVSSKSQRYSIETQTSDLLDELLSTIPNAQRTPRVLNNIHTMIERFKQLREHFSFYDNYGNVEGFVIKEASHKPLIRNYFYDLNVNLYWILPVVKNFKYIYNAENYDEENGDIINLNLDKTLVDLKEIIDNYKSNNMPSDQNKYAELYREIDRTYTVPFKELQDEDLNGVIYELKAINNINTVINNLEDLYSSVYSNNAVRSRRFVIQKYNTGLSKLDTIDSTGSRMVTVRTNMTPDDYMSIKSVIFLPEPVIRFSKINLPGTSILDKVNLNNAFLNYWQFLRKNTNVNLNFIDSFDEEIQFNEQNFANNIKQYVLNLPETHELTLGETYKKYLNHIIPKTRVLFNLMKKYITGKLSIVEVVSYLEPFLIYSDDLTYMQYVEIIDFINEKISQFNKKFIERSRIFKSLTNIKSSAPIPARAYSIIESINRNMRNTVINEGYDISDPTFFTNSEILRKLTLSDYTKLYTTALSIQNFPLMFPSEFSTLFEEEKTKLDGKMKTEEESNKCRTITIAKYYTSMDALKQDDDKVIYFDKKYDKTNYGILEDKDGYEKQVLTMSPDELREHIAKDLMEKKRMSETDAEYLASTLVNGHKQVIDGQFAIVYLGYNQQANQEVNYYIRKNNKWELDSELNKENINTDEASILCDIQEQCISVTKNNTDKCETTKYDELGLQTKLLKDVINEFDTKYKLSSEELKKKITDRFEYLESINARLTKIETNNLLKYNNQKYKLGASIEDNESKPVSPNTKLLSFILGQSDFAKKQVDIVNFVNTFTRPAAEGFGPLNQVESQHWRYCIQSDLPILPTFKFELAEAYVIGGEYDYGFILEHIKSTIGQASDDGDWWCDKHSGWPICPVDFDVEEGYEEGFKVSSRSVMEDDAGNKIMAAALKDIKYITPETRTISNIVNSISVAMGINIETQKEFIINTVLDSIKETVESESDYKSKVREMAEKGKKIMSYRDFYNTAILFYTLGTILIAIQTSIPSVKTRKTHPGCVRSFTGYPFEGQGDLSSLTYIGCVAYDIRESGEPWNVLKGKKIEVINSRIKASIDDVLLANSEVKRKFEEKTVYLLTNSATEIPEEHDIAKWSQFLPPLVRFNIKHLVNISPEFKKSLMSDLRSGSVNQREKLLVVSSKIIIFSLALIERIQEIVKKSHLLLHTSNNEPYLENSCCESKEGENTLSYFSSRDPRITEYNEIVTNLSNIMEDIISYSKGGLFFSDINTKNVYPSITNEFNEKTIYLAFIYFCKFKSLMPIPQDLLPLCTDKPETGLINPNDSVDRMIQKLKEDGRNYKNEQFLRLLQIIGRHNIVNINLNNPEISSITRLTKTLESIDDENDEVVEKSLRDLISNSLDTFDIATENYTQEVKDLNNFLIRNIASMKEEIIEFVQKNTGPNITNSSVRKMTKTIENLSNWIADNSARNENIKISDDKLYNIVNFYKDFISNFVNVFPNIILNKVNYDDVHIPNYYGFSKNHSNKLKNYIGGYYEKLKSFYGNPTLLNVLTTIQKSSRNLIRIANVTPKFSSIKMGEEKTIKPIFDERTSRFLFEYYLLRVLLNYIELSDDEEMVVTEIRKETEVSDIFALEYLEETETRVDLSMTSRNKTDVTLLTGNKKELRQKTAELLLAFVDILNNQKDTIDISYEEIQDRVFKLREREKDMVTDRLKNMTDELRDADTILKINKLGKYSVGMQKGLTMYDKDYYEKEGDLRDEMVKAEKKIRQSNPDANDENIDILIDEYMEQQEVDNQLDDEANDMRDITEDYTDGNHYTNLEITGYGDELVDWDDA
jgi:ribosomal protein S13